MKPSTARVLQVIRQRPVTMRDFDCQPACDGGDRITRLAARILDLKHDGYDVTSRLVHAGSSHVAEYTLVSEPSQPSAARESRRSPGLAIASKGSQEPAAAPERQALPEGAITVRAHIRRLNPTTTDGQLSLLEVA